MRAGTLRLGIAAFVSLAMGACGGGGHGGGSVSTGPPPPPGGGTDPHVQAALVLLNQSRSQFGAAPLTLDATLMSCALRHAQDVASCSNFNLGGFSSCAHNDFKAGDTCSALSENQGVASGVTTSNQDAAFQSINQQMMSEGPPPPGQDNHFLNITNPSETVCGIGFFIDNNGNMWVSEEFR
jgi:hypothetical protein